MKQILTLALASTLLLSACAGTTAPRADGTIPRGEIDEKTLGGLIGGVAGGILGSQIGGGDGRIVTGVAGALIGAWAGTKVAESLTQQDVAYVEETTIEVIEETPVGETIEWYNPESGNQGSVTTTREGETANGNYCREYQQTVTIGGNTEQAYGTACRQPDGAWEIIS